MATCSRSATFANAPLWQLLLRSELRMVTDNQGVQPSLDARTQAVVPGTLGIARRAMAPGLKPRKDESGPI
jgi:hypothetical protein